eukprot:scaffold55737_cov58-Attheya_sp.AAC.1
MIPCPTSMRSCPDLDRVVSPDPTRSRDAAFSEKGRHILTRLQLLLPSLLQENAHPATKGT